MSEKNRSLAVAARFSQVFKKFLAIAVNMPEKNHLLLVKCMEKHGK
jgi:hypothetical protein